DFTFKGTASVAGTNAGSYDMELTADDFANTSKNFTNVVFVVVDGQLVIDPIDVTVTVTEHSATYTYDGEEHEVTGYDVSYSDPLYTANDYTFTGNDSVTGTDAGTYDMQLAAGDFTNTNTNFGNVTFDIVDGQLIIDAREGVVVTITGHTHSDPYDGALHFVENYDVSSSDPLYTVADFEFVGEAKAERTNAGTSEMGLKGQQFINTNDNFAGVTFEVTDGYQTIVPINTTVNIVGNNNTAVYDKNEHKVTGYTATAESSLYDVANDFEFSGTAEAKRTDLGTTYMDLSGNQFENKNENFAKVDFNITDGYQTITGHDEVIVTIIGHNASVDYDGAEHTVSGYDVSTNNALYTENDFSFVGTKAAEAARTDAGTTYMGLTDKMFENNNKNFENVTFNVIDGYQNIKPINVTVEVKGNTSSVPYDSFDHDVSGYTFEASSDLYTADDFEFNGKAYAERKNAGKTNMGLEPEQFANTGENFGTVTFNVTDGYQEITQIETTVTVTGHHNSAVYDGTEHSVSGYDVSLNDLYTAADFTFTGKAEAARTEEGTTLMGLKGDQFKNVNGNFSKVTFEIVDGYQNITPVTDPVVVKITGNNDTKTYNGEAQYAEGFTAVADNKLFITEGENKFFTFNGNDKAERTDAGTTYMGLASEQFAKTTDNFTNVTFEVVADGYMTIEQKAVTVTADNYTKVYDGEFVKDSDLTFTIDGLVEGDSEDLIKMNGPALADGEVKDVKINEDGSVGSYKITFYDQGQYEDQGNYTVTFKDGECTITKRPITATVNNATKTYGSSDPDFSFLLSEELKGEDKLSYEFSREAGEDVRSEGYKIYLSFDNKKAVAPADDVDIMRAVAISDANSNYDITVEAGTLMITPKAATVTVNNATKLVGAQDPTFTGKISGVLAQDKAGLKVRYVRAEQGEAVGQYKLTAKYTDNANYNIKVKTGILTITEESVPDQPEPEQPEPDQPEPDQPEPDQPEPEQPEPEQPEPDQPEPDQPEPEQPEPDQPQIVIDDEPAPLAPTVDIPEEDVPLSNHFETNRCWIHWIILLDTLIYGIYAVVRVVTARKKEEEEEKKTAQN
nr:hypothetical protein [Lachnospiraceae bacterium]